MAQINFLADFKEIITQELCSLGHPPKYEEDLDTVLTRYLNFSLRIPPTIVWTVKQSKELANKNIPQEITLGLQEFIEKAESGQILKPYLSTQSDNPNYKDLMFYDWGIFHFHLGTNPHPKRQGFVERTDDLLFAIAHSHTARMYLIDIHPHRGGFTNQDLLRILEENWPEIIEPYALKGVDGLTYNASDRDIDSLRKASINTVLQTPGGRLLIPMGGGITGAGTSINIGREADRIITNVCQLEDFFIQQRDTIAVYFNDKYANNWDCLKFKVKSFEAPVKIEEITTGEIVELHGLGRR
ncbi:MULTISPECIES: hypothetical protein [unclassified Microcoleus]|uniref:hypothetical protein n=1 Tax=unclassified Microcoleus TaxID=2642155 RepID=UPI002FD5BEC2